MTSAREEILGRIRGALVDVASSELPEDVPVPRRYARRAYDVDVVTLFVERVADYHASVRQIDAHELAIAVAAPLWSREASRIAVPADLPAEWLAELDGVEIVRDEPPLPVELLDQVDAVVTGCALAIAETGTIVLDAGAAQGRRALTLVPDYHLCVVHADQVVGSVPEAVARLDPRRPLTWISGPSATSDIELSRVEGVHGPRTLHVLVVDGRHANPSSE